MPPRCETTSSSLSFSPRFSPSLACIAEEEPQIVYIRRIDVPGGASSNTFSVEIPIYDLNIYEPPPPKTPLPNSYNRLLTQMDKYIANKNNLEKYKEMAENIRRKVAIEQAENRRLSTTSFTNRDWYWYSEETRRFVDEPITSPVRCIELLDDKSNNLEEKPCSSKIVPVENDGSEFDLSADF